MKLNYNRSIVNLTASIMSHYGLKPYHSTLKEVDEQLAKDYKHVAIILLDGLGSNLLKLHKEVTPFFNDKKIVDITSVYPSTTAAATTAVLTGMTPYESGFLGWFQYFKNEDLYYTIFMNQDYYNKDKAIPKGFSEKHFKRDNFTDLIQNATKTRTKVFFPEKVDNNGGYKSIDEGLQSLLKFQQQNESTVSYFYSIEPDMTQHHHGIVSKETKRVVGKLNDAIQHIAKQISDDTLLIITADHGLTDVEPINLFDYHDITSTFEHLPANEPRMTNFFIKDNMREHFINFFNDHFSDYFTLYTKDEFLTKKMLGHGERSYLVDMCLGDFISVAHDKYFFKLTDDKEHHAHHAGITSDEMVVPLMFISGKGD